ncbi:MAG: hypothetical protein ACKVPX_15950 [Myxococcaceae bacterium]
MKAMLLLLGCVVAEAPLAGVPPVRVGDWVTFRAQTDSGDHFFQLSVVGVVAADAATGSAATLEIAFHAGVEPQMRSPLVSLRLRWPLAADGRLDSEAIAVAAASVFGGAFAPFPRPFRPDSARLVGSVHRGRGHVVRREEGVAVKTGRGWVRSVEVDLVYNSRVVQRMWMSDAVPLLSLAKLEVPALGYAVTVVDFGRDATPKPFGVFLVGAEGRGHGTHQ